MSPFGFTALSGAWLFLLIPPLVIFYFLKLKRPRIEIPSLVLWQQVLQDSRVNSPFQRFKRNLLLFLQLLLLLLLILAAMQPFWRGEASRAQRLPILIDVSASMDARHEGSKDTQLDEAKKRITQRIDNLLRGQKICLIAFGDRAKKLTPFTNNKRILKAALDNLVVQDVPGNPEDALRMAQALNSREPFDEVLMITDGNFPERSDFELSYALDYERLPPAGPNAGITSLNARRSGDLSWDVFVNVEGNPEFEVKATIHIEQDGQEIDRQAIALEPGAAERLIFQVPGETEAAFRVRLDPQAFDALAADNTAAIELPALRKLWVYCPGSLPTYHKALAGVEGIRVYRDSGAQANFDVVISDNKADQSLTYAVGLFVGMKPDALADLIDAGEGVSDVVDWERNDPLLQHVNLTDLVIQNKSAYKEGISEVDIEKRDFSILVHGSQGPLLVRRVSESERAYFLLFHTDYSTLPFRIGFPILLTNLKELANNQLGMHEVRAHRTGVLPPLQTNPSGTFHITGPGGQQDRQSNESGLLNGVPAPKVGTYVVAENGQTIRMVHLGLLSPLETRLTGVEKLVFNQLSVEANPGKKKTDRNLWPLMTLLAFVLLLIEWGFYQRKPGGWVPRSAGST